MFDKRVVNGFAIGIGVLFFTSSVVDMVSAEYEMNPLMYGLMTLATTAVFTAAGIVNIKVERKKRGD